MTSVQTRPATAAATRTGSEQVLRVALAVAAPIGALAVGVGKLLLPYDSSADGAGILDGIAAHPALTDALLWSKLLIAVALLPGVIVAGLAALRGAPRLATTALLIAFPAWAAAMVFPDVDGLARAALDTGTPRDATIGLIDHLGSFAVAPAPAAVGMFVIGHIVGTVLLGLALWRSRAVSPVYGWLLAVSQPLHFVAFAVLGIPVLDFAAYTLTAVGFAAAGISFARNHA